MATWSGIRKKLENEYLAESLRGHIQYFATTYRESHDREGRAAILLDGEEIVSGGYYKRWSVERLFRRVGKRKLLLIKNRILEEPELFQVFYAIRADAEKINQI